MSICRSTTEKIRGYITKKKEFTHIIMHQLVIHTYTVPVPLLTEHTPSDNLVYHPNPPEMSGTQNCGPLDHSHQTFYHHYQEQSCICQPHQLPTYNPENSVQVKYTNMWLKNHMEEATHTERDGFRGQLISGTATLASYPGVPFCTGRRGRGAAEEAMKKILSV